jgi:hypothetical protein
MRLLFPWYVGHALVRWALAAADEGCGVVGRAELAGGLVDEPVLLVLADGPAPPELQAAATVARTTAVATAANGLRMAPL